ncbi:MAG: DUF177 domain-containing protein [Actinomycetota bacterium]|nr:DUF177 domain-containing protein [Actinomycetota bacterium]
MSPRTDAFDLAGMRLSSGEGRHLQLQVGIDPFELAGERYRVEGGTVPVTLDVSRTTGAGYSLRMRFEATLTGPCMRCLEPATPTYEIDAREVSQPGGGEELESPYVESSLLDIRAWTRDALALALPAAVLCAPACAGLCAVCGENLNRAGPGHDHERAPDPRWDKLSELRLQ